MTLGIRPRLLLLERVRNLEKRGLGRKVSKGDFLAKLSSEF